MSISLEPSSVDSKSRRQQPQPQPTKDKDLDSQSVSGSIPSDVPKGKKCQCRTKDDVVCSESNGLLANLPVSFKVSSFLAKDGLDMASSREFWKSLATAIFNQCHSAPAIPSGV
ncbi:hypothetical protein M404DRAFT_25734 [Pisolithus tinctorius Marx 270]|uniref:Uncharacterized protein n=1 Tax=Pisolithus tinctorius Marx 270 TaxID=870435 RepID=A0A0C3PAZ9_PISTI|nr:hypothetical protein M404DRAFT_25734 [Pisolithus tinctorius Marx 270]